MLLRGGNFLPDDGQRIGDAFDHDAVGDQFHAVELYIFVGVYLTHHGNDGIAGELIQRGAEVRMLFLLHSDLHFAGDVLQNDKGHGFAIAVIFHKALHLDGLSGHGERLRDVGAFQWAFSFRYGTKMPLRRVRSGVSQMRRLFVGFRSFRFGFQSSAHGVDIHGDRFLAVI